ncbi:MAG: MBL fold metallo-hydrolase [Coriobacteriales bacterium]|nr:MBL fold metallo-hydrolase [Coriobacteriales bacterium]
MGTPNLISARELRRGLWQFTDVLENRAYLVVGSERALLVDTMGGYGDLRACIAQITDLPLELAFTHNHQDHVGGSYGFGRAYISEADDHTWEREREFADLDRNRLLEQGLIAADDYWAPREGDFPELCHVQEGDCFDLGSLTVEAISLPGHTAGSMGYLVRELKVLLLGDAVTPIMCLFFEESLSVDAWRATLAKLETVDFDVFYTGHHGVAFDKSELESFDACAQNALVSRGLPWMHSFLPYEGTLYLFRGEDADAPDFRALIGPYVPRVRKRRRRRHGAI